MRDDCVQNRVSQELPVEVGARHCEGGSGIPPLTISQKSQVKPSTRLNPENLAST